MGPCCTASPGAEKGKGDRHELEVQVVEQKEPMRIVRQGDGGDKGGEGQPSAKITETEETIDTERLNETTNTAKNPKKIRKPMMFKPQEIECDENIAKQEGNPL